MYFDALTIAAVADELRDTILGGRIQRVLLTGPLSIGLEIYAKGRRYQLLASAHTQFARVHLVRARLTRGVEQDTPLLLLMRKYLLGGRIMQIEQPALERLLLLSIAKPLESRNKGADQGEPTADSGAQDALDDEQNQAAEDALEAAIKRGDLLYSDLIIEPMDRRSNIILVDDNNVVLESVKRVTPRMSRRVIMPRQVYELPPAQTKRDPTQASAAGIESLATTHPGDLGKAILSAYRGVSPQAAREAIFRATGQPTAQLDTPLPWYTIAARLRELFSEAWQPSMVLNEQGPLAYAPYALQHLGAAEPRPSISAALEEFYAAQEQFTGHQQRRDALSQQLATARERLVRQQNHLQGELRKAEELEILRWEGEMIFAFLHEIRPRQAELVVEERKIILDPLHSPVEQAQERFKAYDKSKSALAGLPERLEMVANRLASLDELVVLLKLSDEYAQIEQIAIEAEELGYLQEHPDPVAARRRKTTKARPLHLVMESFDIFVGRSARQNEEVTFQIGHIDDLWLHARNIHGSHVIIRSGGRDVPLHIQEAAAGLAAYFSQARDEGAVEIDICRRALVRKIAGGPIGRVSYRAEQTLRVAPRQPW